MRVITLYTFFHVWMQLCHTKRYLAVRGKYTIVWEVLNPWPRLSLGLRKPLNPRGRCKPQPVGPLDTGKKKEDLTRTWRKPAILHACRLFLVFATDLQEDLSIHYQSQGQMPRQEVSGLSDANLQRSKVNSIPLRTVDSFRKRGIHIS